MRHPDLFLIGTQKGGSSSFFRGLCLHPEIARMAVKECNIYTQGTPEAVTARLAECQPAGEPVTTRYLIDASTDYSRFPKFPDVPRTIRALCPVPEALRFLYVMRHPVERLISNYFWRNQLYGLPHDLTGAIEAEPQFLATSRYDLQIEHYLKTFPRAQFHFVKSESFYADPPGELRRAFLWLGLDPDIDLSALPHRGATDKARMRTPRFGMLNRLLWKAPALRRALRGILPDRMVRKLARATTRETPRPTITRAEKQALLTQHFTDSIRRTAELTGLDLDDWLSAYDGPQRTDTRP